jgi:hypothetical protein
MRGQPSRSRAETAQNADWDQLYDKSRKEVKIKMPYDTTRSK